MRTTPHPGTPNPGTPVRLGTTLAAPSGEPAA